MRFNGDTASNYAFSYMVSSVATFTGGSQSTAAGFMPFFQGTQQGNDGFGANVITIFDYTSSNVWKTYVFAGGAANDAAYGELELGGGTWKSTAAINSITSTNESGTFISGSRFDLYGIKGA
jgi:hypothetical protein